MKYQSGSLRVHAYEGLKVHRHSKNVNERSTHPALLRCIPTERVHECLLRVCEPVCRKRESSTHEKLSVLLVIFQSVIEKQLLI
jgi:hypothetical protein